MMCMCRACSPITRRWERHGTSLPFGRIATHSLLCARRVVFRHCLRSGRTPLEFEALLLLALPSPFALAKLVVLAISDYPLIYNSLFFLLSAFRQPLRRAISLFMASTYGRIFSALEGKISTANSISCSKLSHDAIALS